MLTAAMVMAGGGSRRAGAAEQPKIGSGNVFAALKTLKKKKPADKGAKPAAREDPKPEVHLETLPRTSTTRSYWKRSISLEFHPVFFLFSLSFVDS
jgi:hypothetical protein